MIPSGKFDVVRTPLHDKVHLWISKNSLLLLNSVSVKVDGWGDFDCKYLKIEIEKPLYSGNYLCGIVDGVIDVGDIYDDGSTLYRRLIYEIKPRLNSISSAVGQIKSYAKLLEYDSKYSSGEKPLCTIVTIDKSMEYDELVMSQDIVIYHVPKEELTN